jgi:flagellum-specific peptidoglycan hydrolase FlgJ
VTPTAFIAAIAPPARSSAAMTGIHASFTIAEAALESGWGGSGLTTSANNLFGVKADPSWTGDVLELPTREFIKTTGQWITVVARWRKYPDWLASINDHAKFLLDNERYHAALQCPTVEDFCRAVQAAGYATDPQYADKIISIIAAHNLKSFDL